MTVAIILAAAIFVLLIVLASRSNTPRTDDNSEPPYTQPPRPRKPRDDQYFINSHLHRNDEKHERHKRNQTPW